MLWSVLASRDWCADASKNYSLHRKGVFNVSAGSVSIAKEIDKYVRIVPIKPNIKKIIIGVMIQC